MGDLSVLEQTIGEVLNSITVVNVAFFAFATAWFVGASYAVEHIPRILGEIPVPRVLERMYVAAMERKVEKKQEKERIDQLLDKYTPLFESGVLVVKPTKRNIFTIDAAYSAAEAKNS